MIALFQKRYFITNWIEIKKCYCISNSSFITYHTHCLTMFGNSMQVIFFLNLEMQMVDLISIQPNCLVWNKLYVKYKFFNKNNMYISEKWYDIRKVSPICMILTYHIVLWFSKDQNIIICIISWNLLYTCTYYDYYNHRCYYAICVFCKSGRNVTLE